MRKNVHDIVSWIVIQRQYGTVFSRDARTNVTVAECLSLTKIRKEEEGGRRDRRRDIVEE